MLSVVAKKYGRTTYEHLKNLIRELATEPEKRGQALRGVLKGLYSLHYSRFRVIYRIQNEQVRVIVLAAGHHSSGAREDIYKSFSRWVKEGSIGELEE